MPRRDLPSENEYTVIGCPDCEALQIIKGNPKTTKCDRCRKTLQFRELRFLYRSKSHDASKQARAMKLAERNDDKQGYLELLRSGELDSNEVRGLTKEEFLEAQGIDPDEYSGGKQGGNEPSVHEAIEQAIEELDSPTVRTVVVEVTDEHSHTEEDVRDMLDRLRRQGKVAKKSGGKLRFV